MRYRAVGDCAVRAVSVAYGIGYDEAFRILDAEADGTVQDFHRKIGGAVINGWRLLSAAGLLTTGRFICAERRGGHVVAYIDGVRYDLAGARCPGARSGIWALVAENPSSCEVHPSGPHL
jgi:hypothetical protein